jgi:hypothetical protein
MAESTQGRANKKAVPEAEETEDTENPFFRYGEDGVKQGTDV